jgi:hypothetical protein
VSSSRLFYFYSKTFSSSIASTIKDASWAAPRINVIPTGSPWGVAPMGTVTAGHPSIFAVRFENVIASWVDTVPLGSRTWVCPTVHNAYETVVP